MIIMVDIIGISIFKNDDLFPKSNLWSNKKESKEDTETKENAEIKADESLAAAKEFKDDKTFEIGEEVLTDDLMFKVNSVEKTKERKQFPNPPDWDLIVKDENGNLINDMSYVIVNVTIKNQKETERVFPLNSCWVNAIDDRNERYTYQCWMSSKLDDFDKKDYFEYTFQPKEEYTCDLVYIVEDERLQNNNLIFDINISGVIGYDDDSRYIKLKLILEEMQNNEQTDILLNKKDK